MKRITIVIALAMASYSAVHAQTSSVAIGTATTDPNAVLLLVGNGSQGFIIPKVASAAALPLTAGMIVYQTAGGAQANKVFYCNGSSWVEVGGGGGGGTTYTLQLTGNALNLVDATSTVISTINLADALNGDVVSAGTPNGKLRVSGLQGSPIPSTLPTASTGAYALSWNSATSTWQYQSNAALTTLGDLMTHDGTRTARLARGTSGQVLTTSVGGALQWTAPGGVTTGNLTSGTTGLTVTGGAGAVVGSGTTLSIQNATAAQPGLLTAADFTTFNNKLGPFTSQTANTVFAAPNGSAGVPSFRALVAGDISSGQLALANGGTAANTAAGARLNLGLGNVAYTWPGANASGVLTNDGAGALTWAPSGGSGTVTSVSVSGLPLSIINPTVNPTISIAQANTSTAGFLTAADWNTFNGKLGSATVATGDLSGTFGTPTVAKIQGTAVSGTAPIATQVLQYNGVNWAPTTLALGLTNPMTTQGDIIFGGALGVATRLGGSAGFLKSTGAFAPTWSAVSLTADVSGLLPIANGGTGASSTSANFAFIGPAGAPGAPTFRALVAADIPNHDASKITTGTLAVARGGTGVATVPTAGQMLIGTGAAYIPLSLSGDVLSVTAGGVVTLSNSAATRTNLGLGALATLPLVTTTEILNSTILDADVSPGAAIAGSKITPAFGAQPVSTTSTLGVGTIAPASELEVQGVSPKITLRTTGAGVAETATFDIVNSGGTSLGSIGDPGSGSYLQIASPATIVFNTNFLTRAQISNAGSFIVNTPSSGTALDVSPFGNWDLTSTEGDFRLGNATYRLKAGVSTAGGGAGDVYINAHGGTNRLFLGSAESTANSQTMTIAGGHVAIGNTSPASPFQVFPGSFATGTGNGDSELFHNGGQFGSGILSVSSSGGDGTGTLYASAKAAGIESNPTGSNNFGLWGHNFNAGAGGWGIIASNGASLVAPTTYVALGGSSDALRIVDGNQAAGAVLKSDASGNASWGPVQTIAFSAYNTGNPAFATGWNVIPVPTEEYDLSTNFSANTFTVPSGGAGLYHFVANVNFNTPNANSRYQIAIWVNGVAKKSVDYVMNGASFESAHIDCDIMLAVGDTVQAEIFLSAIDTGFGAQNYIYFQGRKVN